VAPQDVTGTVRDADLEETLRLALSLHPDRKAVVGDGTDFGRAALTRLRDIEPPFAWQAEFLPLQGLDADDLAEAGRLRGNLGVIVDLSELKAREETLRLSEKRLQTALEGAAEGASETGMSPPTAFISALRASTGPSSTTGRR
jgi:PAS domain-containing protein